jgi:hypothetical protein
MGNVYLSRWVGIGVLLLHIHCLNQTVNTITFHFTAKIFLTYKRHYPKLPPEKRQFLIKIFL